MASSTERNRRRRHRLAREKQVRTFGVDLATLPDMDAILAAIAVSPTGGTAKAGRRATVERGVPGSQLNRNSGSSARNISAPTRRRNMAVR
jgi:hypothetical protein